MTPAEAEALVPLAAELIAACAGHPEPLWDATVDGEHEGQRIKRQTRALAICRRCPLRAECAATVDLKHDDGIRGGMVLPTIRDKDRRNANQFVPGRGGMSRLARARETSRCSRETSGTNRLREQDAALACAKHERAADPDGTPTNPGAFVMFSPQRRAS